MTTLESSPKDTWIVVPAFNEAQVIAKVVAPLVASGYSVIVVDDCSSDETGAQLDGSGVYLVRHPINLGQGAALQTGIGFALQHDAEFIVTFDSDGQHQHSDIPRLIEPLRMQPFDVALGTRFSGTGTAVDMPPGRRLLLRVATAGTRWLIGLRVTDTHNGFRAFRASAAAQLSITQNRMAHATQILTQIRTQRLRYCEVGVKIIYTEYSLRKGQRMSNMFNIMWESFTEFFRL